LFSNFCFLKKNHTTANKTNAKAWMYQTFWVNSKFNIV
jgi:hypothetical protein